MKPSSTGSTPRRSFLGRLAAGVMASGVPWVTARAAGTVAQAVGPEDFLEGLNGTYKCLYDIPLRRGAVTFVHMRNFMRAYSDTFGVPPSDVNAVATLYTPGPQSTQALAFSDTMWEKYAIGEFTDMTDVETGRPLT